MRASGLIRHLPNTFRSGWLDSTSTTNNYIEFLRENHPVVAPKSGVIHVGAHKCEELPFYSKLKLNHILWIDGNDQLCQENPSIINALLSDEDGKEVDFIITNNDGLSSSILELKEHRIEHPDCLECERVKKTTITLDTLMCSYDQASMCDMLVLDVQGAELLVLKGGVKTLQHINCIVTEVNTKELYEKCALVGDLDTFLEEQGFVRVFTKMTRHGWGDAVYVRRVLSMRVHSGLGNRLFQLAALYALAKSTKSIAVLYDKLIDVCSIHCDDKSKYDIFYDHFVRLPGEPLNAFTETVSEHPNKPCVYTDYSPHIHTSTKPIILFDGFFQSQKYFLDYQDDVRYLFLTSLINRQTDEIEENIDSFIHVRGRDHIHPRNVAHSLPDISTYYKDALERFQQCRPTNTVIITDDAKYVSTLEGLSKFKCYQSTDELDDLYMMCQCTNVAITTNSTFSWWGAFLANSDTVVMPFPYLLADMEYQDIYPDGVTKINACDGKRIFSNIVSARICGDKVTIILVRKGSKDKWFLDENAILVNGTAPLSINHTTEARHNDAYNHFCIIEAQVSDGDGDEYVHLCINYCTQTVPLAKPVSSAKYNLVAMTMFKNDRALINSWVQHHTRLGVEHFFLYYNDDKPISELPIIPTVTYIPWPYPYFVEYLHYAQLGAMTDMIHQARSFTKYVLFSDLDEYILWRPEHISLQSFVMNNDFAIYGFLNNFIVLDNPTEDVASQVENGEFSRTYEMLYGTRSKNIVNVHEVDAMGIHKPLDDALDNKMCVLASRTCELLHVCNFEGRKHVSVTDQTLYQLKKVAKKT